MDFSQGRLCREAHTRPLSAARHRHCGHKRGLRNPRPIYWLHPLKPYHFAGAFPYTVDEGLARRYTGRKERPDSIDTERFFRTLTSGSPRFRFGNASGCYVDPTSASVTGRLRQSMLRLALQLLEEGKPEKALAVAQAIEREIPFSSLESRVFTDNYLAFSEATELARIYGKCSGTLGKPELKQKAFALLRDETERLGHWRRFYTSLPAWRKKAMSGKPRIEQGQLYSPVALWLELGGSRSELSRMPALKGLDMAKEKREWEKSSTLRRMLRLARFPENDSVEAALYRRYRDLGGRASDLKKLHRVRLLTLREPPSRLTKQNPISRATPSLHSHIKFTKNDRSRDGNQTRSRETPMTAIPTTTPAKAIWWCPWRSAPGRSSSKEM